jgi:hypothetical protein
MEGTSTLVLAADSVMKKSLLLSVRCSCDDKRTQMSDNICRFKCVVVRTVKCCPFWFLGGITD